MNKTIEITVNEDETQCRIDKYLGDKLEGYTRSYIQKLIENSGVLINGNVVKPKQKVSQGDNITIVIPKTQETEIVPEDIPLDIVYEDDDMLVVNKPQGMVVHPAPGNYTGTLVNALMWHCGDSLSGINGEKRPGILHRIDKDTSGLLLVAKNDNAHQKLSEQIKEHSLTRAYKAIVHGNIKEDSGVIDAPIGRDSRDRKMMTITYVNSRDARTHFNVLERYGKYTLIECILETGRTHQIRVHLSKNRHPVVGDKTYGVKKEEFNLAGQLLHAYKIGFIHPKTGEYMEFLSELPPYYQKILKYLRNL
ncbi:MAG: RluA family pseudouridine synthase [Oscillospiraceae bacterium]